jgi:hypothetical protein
LTFPECGLPGARCLADQQPRCVLGVEEGVERSKVLGSAAEDGVVVCEPLDLGRAGGDLEHSAAEREIGSAGHLLENDLNVSVGQFLTGGHGLSVTLPPSEGVGRIGPPVAVDDVMMGRTEQEQVVVAPDVVI